MYTLRNEMKGGEVRPLEKKSQKTVKLLSQDASGKVTFMTAGGGVETVPSHEFFALYGEATPAEIEKYGKGDKEPTPA